MKRSSVLSRAFFRRPAVRDLVPDLKLALTVITVGCESHAGVFRPAGLPEDTGLDSSALAGALDDLERRGHISRDPTTGELFLADFFRDNSFATPARRGQARDDFCQIESPALRGKVIQAICRNPECGLSETDFIKNQQFGLQGKGEAEVEEKGKEKKRVEAEGAPSARAAAPARQTFYSSPKKQKTRCTRPSGLVTWSPADDAVATQIEENYPADEVAKVVQRLVLHFKDPLPGLVRRELDRQAELEVARHRAKEQEKEQEIRIQKLIDEGKI